jgi:hypothetical protein
MNQLRYFMLGVLACMALAAIAIFVYRILSPSRAPLEVGGIVACLSLLGVLGFLIGCGLVLYDSQRYEWRGLVLAGCGWVSVLGTSLFAQWKSRRRP